LCIGYKSKHIVGRRAALVQ